MLTDTLATTHMPAADTQANAALKDARELALTTIQPSPYNKMRSERIQQSWLETLAASIKSVGLLQPIVVRMIEAPAGRPQFEIVAGECRWRATKLAGKTTIPVMVKDLTDLEAREMMVMENTHRNDLHPLEEAEGYEALLLDPPKGAPRLSGYTPDELAARFGKSRTYIYNRLKLLDLLPEGRKAFYAGDLSTSTAQMVARMPAHFQVEAIKRLKQGWGGEPMSSRQAADFIQNNYMLQLGKAQFKITDESLLPEAGSCKACPKRTGANPDLFGDVKGADVCTDPKCFNAKKDAHQARMIAQAKEEGLKVIQGKEAKALKKSEHSDELKGYLRLDKVHHSISGDKPLDKLLGKDAPEVSLLEDPRTHEVIKVVKTDEAMAVLKDKGIVKSNKLSSTSATERAKEQRRKADIAWRQEVARDLLADLVKREGFDDHEFGTCILPELARLLWKRLGSDDCRRVEKVLGLQSQLGAVDDILDNAPDSARFHELLLAMLVAHELQVSTYVDKPAPPAVMIDIAVRFGYDEAALLAERQREIKTSTEPAKKAAAKAIKPATKKPAAKAPAAKKAAPATKQPAAKAEGKPVAAKKAAPKGEAKATDKEPASMPAVAPDEALELKGPTVSKSGQFWHLQHVRVKATKKVGIVRGTGDDEQELITVRLQSGGKEGDSYDARYSAGELEVLPGQTKPAQLSPADAWPFPNTGKP